MSTQHGAGCLRGRTAGTAAGSGSQALERQEVSQRLCSRLPRVPCSHLSRNMEAAGDVSPLSSSRWRISPGLPVTQQRRHTAQEHQHGHNPVYATVFREGLYPGRTGHRQKGAPAAGIQERAGAGGYGQHISPFLGRSADTALRGTRIQQRFRCLDPPRGA